MLLCLGQEEDDLQQQACIYRTWRVSSCGEQQMHRITILSADMVPTNQRTFLFFLFRTTS